MLNIINPRLSFFLIELIIASLLFTRKDDWNAVFSSQRRMRLLVFPCIILLYSLTPFYIFAYNTNNTSLITSLAATAYYLCTALLIITCIRFVSGITWIKALVVVACGYCVQHIAFDMHAVVSRLAHLPAITENFGIYDIYYFIIYSFVFLTSYFLCGRSFSFDEHKIRRAPAWIAICIVLLLLLIFVNLFYIQQADSTTHIALYTYDGIATVFALTSLQQSSTNNRLIYDLEVMQRIDALQERHYELAKENVELINEVGHDLRRFLSDSRRTEQTQEAVNTYDSMFRTGNEALDVLLTERSLYCSSRHIILTALVDGSQLSFMNSGTVYSLVGNLVDNAIEYVEKYATAEKPGLVDVNVHSSGQLVLIEISNPLNTEVIFEDGIPVSTKRTQGDASLHGYGTKSAMRQVHNMGGEINISTDNGAYTVTIIVPRNS
ncbi:ATP-binding protein [Alloscardovia omnicolens]|uniref:ATP-binding protein n=1 Tax=Alloscardovia omnicolens TaxID=419015 RepID=UPI003A715612